MWLFLNCLLSLALSAWHCPELASALPLTSDPCLLYVQTSLSLECACSMEITGVLSHGVACSVLTILATLHFFLSLESSFFVCSFQFSSLFQSFYSSLAQWDQNLASSFLVSPFPTPLISPRIFFACHQPDFQE